jgi:hypothetical protein
MASSRCRIEPTPDAPVAGFAVFTFDLAFLRHNRRLPLVAPTADGGAFVLALGQLVPGV